MAQGQTPVLPYHNESRISEARSLSADQVASREKEEQQQTSETASGRSSSSVSTLDAPPGYPKLAELMNILPETSIFRRFGTLNSLNLLYLQAELTDIERKLRKAQVADHKAGTGFRNIYAKNWYFLEASAQDGDDQQLQLVNLAREKLDKYSKCQNEAIALAKHARKHRLAQELIDTLLNRRSPDSTRKDPLLQSSWQIRHGLHPAIPGF